MEKISIRVGISRISLPSSLFNVFPIAASSAPVFMTSAIYPPITRQYKMMSTESINPVIGAMITAQSPCGCDVIAWNVPAIGSSLSAFGST